MSYSFIIGDEVAEDVGSTPLMVKVTLTEGDFNNDGLMDVQVQLDVIQGNIADLRGFFLNLSDDALLAGLTITGDWVTATAVDTDGNGTGDISSVGGPGIQAVINPLSFEAGAAFGTAGMAGDDLQSVTFTLSSTGGDLGYDALVGEDIGIRATSVGDDREGSSKLTGTVPPPPDEPPPTVFEGLSHGYWKNHAADWDIGVGASFESFFGVDTNWSLGGGKKATVVADVTFEQALALTGGGVQALAREAVAAVLNIADEDVTYRYSLDEVKAIVQNAFLTGDFTTAKDLLEAQNTVGLEQDFLI